ncbi:DUF3226 domain-containing protein [uncultured Chryseobacterium sp.]|uniref:DUF3226 domain-containing protein n=1 Tax=uncultured Chryseobacterium sp. TaxID=259322 RepID=UPI0025E1276E|nr:DUF3226 domain-containing protein [uncultured Chryseobacterium sp.]
MKEYGLNKIFVEGESDKKFIDFLLLQFFGINNPELVIDVKGKDKLKDNPLLINERRRSEKAKNLIIFDTDFNNSVSKGGREKRLGEYEAIGHDLNIQLSIFLLPFNDQNEGLLEDLLNTCLKEEFNFFDNCWNKMIECAKASNVDKINLPAQKAFLFSKIDLFKEHRSEEWNYKSSSKYQYDDNGIWVFERNKNENLDKLLKFIEDNLFKN